jgi:hypothetical protein
MTTMKTDSIDSLIIWSQNVAHIECHREIDLKIGREVEIENRRNLEMRADIDLIKEVNVRDLEVLHIKGLIIRDNIRSLIALQLKDQNKNFISIDFV